jgi:putative transposase
MKKFKNKYRIPSARASWWNYANEGTYYITICTKNKVNYFGEIIQTEMFLNEMGEVVMEEWLKTPGLRPDMNLTLGAFVIMPNHFHAVLFIGGNPYNGASDFNVPYPDTTDRVATPFNRAGKVMEWDYPQLNQFGPQTKNLASILRGFKSAVTTYARKSGMPFDWQTRYHDHIIRSEQSYNNITEYIQRNPENWNNDPLR